jgi:hypothetical protein
MIDDNFLVKVITDSACNKFYDDSVLTLKIITSSRYVIELEDLIR